MLDQHILRQEHHDMDIYSAREEGREEGIELGREEGLELGREEGIEQGILQEKRHLVQSMLAEGLDKATVCRIAQLTEVELNQLLSEGVSLG